MADSFVQGSFGFTCSIDEAALIEEAWQLSADLSAGFEPGSVSSEFRAIFPPKVEDDPFNDRLARHLAGDDLRTPG